METIKTLTVPFEFEGKTLEAKITVLAEVDQDYRPEDDLEDAGDIEAVRSGRVTPTIIDVQARIDGIDVYGSDCMGACLISGPDDFDDYVNDQGMIQNALAELEREIKDQRAALNSL